MQRYFILDIKATGCKNKKTGFIDYKIKWYVVPTMGEAIGDNCFYRPCNWCREVWCELYDATTGTLIFRKKTLEELKKCVYDEDFKIMLYKLRKSSEHQRLEVVFTKATEEYEARKKGENSKEQ